MAVWMRTTLRPWTIAVSLALAALVFPAPCDRAGAAGPLATIGPVLGGALPDSPPAPLFAADNWWSVDVSSAPVDANSASYIQFINNCATCCPGGPVRHLHPDFGGDVAPGSVQTYGIPYAVVDGTQPKRSVIFQYSKESDGVDHATNTSYAFYPLPDEAITQPHWVEGGEEAAVDLRSQQDRHLIVVDRDHRYLYELWNVWYDSAQNQWYAGSGAFFDMNTNGRRPEGWTSADAAGLAMLPGLVRYDEVYYNDPTGAYAIPHAFRVTVRATNGHVYPASHSAGSTTGALPMGARLRLKASRDVSGFPPALQRIFNAMKTHGLIVADNGSDMFITGTYDQRWNNDILNPAFSQLTACDFEVVQLGWEPAISVTPSSRDFGNVAVGSVADRTFTVQSTGGGPLTGTASTSAPFSILSGASYSLGPGASQTVTVRLSPTSAATFAGNVTFTGGGGATRAVTGAGVDTAALQAFVTRFYSSALERSPDPAGLATWVNFLLASCNAAGFNGLAVGFFDSPEFRLTKPQTLTTLITKLYNTFLERNPEPVGLAA